MNEKEKKIIESAIKRFAKKGFTSTSIQEIASDSGISKGAFYLHFKSKDALLIAILNYYFETLQERVGEIEDKPLPPKEKFITLLTVVLETLVENKEFIIMQSREQAIPLNDEVKKIIFKMHTETHQFYHINLTNIYGSKVSPYLWDLSFILDGILQSYLKILFFNNGTFQIKDVAQFIFNRLNTIINGLVNSNEKPLLTESTIHEMLKRANIMFDAKDTNIKRILSMIKQELETLEEKKDLEVTLQVIESEIARDNPRYPVIQGMLSNFDNFPQFEKYIERIKAIYQK